MDQIISTFLPTLDLVQFVPTSKLSHKRCKPQLFSRIKCTYLACTVAAEKGYFDVLEWGSTNDTLFPWGRILCTLAIRRGRLNVLQWLLEFKNAWLCYAHVNVATSGGHIDILTYLVSQGIYPDEYTSARAAKNGDLETLKWLRENGCPWDTKCRRTTHAHIQTYLDEDGCPT